MPNQGVIYIKISYQGVALKSSMKESNQCIIWSCIHNYHRVILGIYHRVLSMHHIKDPYQEVMSRNHWVIGIMSQRRIKASYQEVKELYLMTYINELYQGIILKSPIKKLYQSVISRWHTNASYQRITRRSHFTVL